MEGFRWARPKSAQVRRNGRLTAWAERRNFKTTLLDLPLWESVAPISRTPTRTTRRSRRRRTTATSSSMASSTWSRRPRSRIRSLRRFSYSSSSEIVGAPDLIIEILSPGTVKRDRGQKKRLYARNGVREYWIVDVSCESIDVFALGSRGYWRPTRYGAADRVASAVVPGFEAACRRGSRGSRRSAWAKLKKPRVTSRIPLGEISPGRRSILRRRSRAVKVGTCP